MNRLRFIKYGSALLASGAATTTITRSVIYTDSDKNDDDETTIAKSFDSFKKTFVWFKKDDEPLIKPSPQNKDLIINELHLKQAYQAPKYPIILCHGLSGFDKLILLPSFNMLTGILTGKAKQQTDFFAEDKGGVSLQYWIGIQEALEAKGSTVMVAKVPGFGSIEERAEELNKFITRSVDRIRKHSKEDIYNDDNDDKRTFKEKGEKLKVNLVAHSMGGLDSRYLISKLEMTNYEVVSLTTVTTPHRGSEMADYIVELAKTSNLRLPTGICELTTEYLKAFNKEVVDDPKVLYFSYGAKFQPRWYNVFNSSWSIIKKESGDNDGMVSVQSAKWGTYLGTLVNVDHLDLINWTNAFKRVATTISPTSQTIDTVALYLDIADNLAKHGL